VEITVQLEVGMSMDVDVQCSGISDSTSKDNYWKRWWWTQ